MFHYSETVSGIDFHTSAKQSSLAPLNNRTQYVCMKDAVCGANQNLHWGFQRITHNSSTPPPIDFKITDLARSFFFNLHAKYQHSTRHRLRLYSRTDRQTNRQTDKQTNRQTDRQTDRQTHTRFSAMAADFKDVPRQKTLYLK